MTSEEPNQEAGPEPNGPPPSATCVEETGPPAGTEADTDLSLIAQLVRDFRTMAAASDAAVPAWVEALERISGLGRGPAGTSKPRPVIRETVVLRVDPVEAPGAEAAGAETVRSEAPHADLEAGAVEAVSATAMHVETPRAQAASVDAPRTEAPGVHAVPVEPPLAEAAGTEAGTVEVCHLEARRIQGSGLPALPATLSPYPAATFFDGRSDAAQLAQIPTFILPPSAQVTLVTVPEWTQPALPENAAFLSEICFRQAETHRERGEHQAAMDCYREAIRLNPQLVAARFERGQLLRIEGQVESAIGDFTAALALDPNHVEAYLRRGNAFAEQGCFDDAVADYSAAIERAPDNAHAYLSRGLAYAKKQDYEKVIDDVNVALRLDPNLAGAAFLRSLAYSHVGRHDLALADLDRAVQLDARTASLSAGQWQGGPGEREPRPASVAPPRPDSFADVALPPPPPQHESLAGVAPPPPLAAVAPSAATVAKPAFSRNWNAAWSQAPGIAAPASPAADAGTPADSPVTPGAQATYAADWNSVRRQVNDTEAPALHPVPDAGMIARPPASTVVKPRDWNSAWTELNPPGAPATTSGAPAHAGPVVPENRSGSVADTAPQVVRTTAPERFSLTPVETPAPPTSSSLMTDLVAAAPDSDDSDSIMLGDLEPLEPRAPATVIGLESPGTALEPPTSPAEPKAAAAEDRAAALGEKYFQKGESYRQKSDFKRARACYNEALRLNPQAVPALLERGQIYRLARKPDLAIVDFNAALAVDPGSVEGYLRRGNALVDQSRFDEAIEDYGAAIQIAPQNASAYLNRALAFAKKQENARVIEDANKALALNPDLAAAYLLRGVAYSNRNSHELAVADLNRAVVLEPRNALAFNERGLAFARRGNYPQAITNYTRALALAPKLAVARFNRALARRLGGAYDLSIAEFSEFIEHHPKVAEAYFNRGLAYRARREYPAAVADFGTALSLKPDYQEAMQLQLETMDESAVWGSKPSTGGGRQVRNAAKPATTADPAPRTFSQPVPSRTQPVPPPSPASAGNEPVSAPPPAWAPPEPLVPPAWTPPIASPPTWTPPVAPPPSRSSSWAAKSRRNLDPALRRRALWASGAVFGIALAILVISLLFGSTSDAASDDADRRLSAQQLCDKFQNAPAEAAALKGKDLEISGVAESTTLMSDGSPPTLVLAGGSKNAPGNVRCVVDPMAKSSMFANVQKGKYVIVQGRCDGIEGGATVTLSKVRVVFVANLVARPKKKK